MTQYLIEAFHNLAATKLRTLLAMLGILVGTASVVAMVSSGQLATQQALAQFKNLGTDMLSLSVYSQGGSDSEAAKKIDVDSYMELPKTIPAIKMVAPYSTTYADTTVAGEATQASIIGATESLADVIKIKIVQGRFISDLDNYANFCVIGHEVAEKLAFADPIGQQIKIGNNYFTIVGVADEWQENSFFNQDINNSIIVPIKAAHLLSKYANVNNAVLRLQEDAPIAETEDQIKQQLIGDSSDKKLFFRSAKEIIKSMTAQHKIFTWLLGLIGSISLLVGGIGVMNIMLVSVLERRREIGIRLALGARRYDIQRMFLSEAVMLALVGGVIGIILGILIAFIIALFAHWEFTIFFLPPAAGFTVSVLTGVFFGFYPALQASRLNPIETLRTE